jgi:hypothetical protein
LNTGKSKELEAERRQEYNSESSVLMLFSEDNDNIKSYPEEGANYILIWNVALSRV